MQALAENLYAMFYRVMIKVLFTMNMITVFHVNPYCKHTFYVALDVRYHSELKLLCSDWTGCRMLGLNHM